MTIAEYNRLQKELEEHKDKKPLRKISNNFLDNTIHKSNLGSLKTIFYLATIYEKMDLHKLKDDELVTVNIQMPDFTSYSQLDERVLLRSLKQMQETSISFIDEENEAQLHINLLPFIYKKPNSKEIEIKLFNKIAKMIIDVERNYTYLNTKSFMSLDSKHSIRMLGLLNKIDDYDYKLKDTQMKKDIPKLKKMTLEELNEFFGTRYKTWGELKRKVIDVAEEELERKSSLYFTYEINFKNTGKGRPKFDYVKIYAKYQEGVQTRLANFID